MCRKPVGDGAKRTTGFVFSVIVLACLSSALGAMSASSKRTSEGVGPLPQFWHLMPSKFVRLAGRWTRQASPMAWRPSVALLRERERWPLWLPVWLGAGTGLYFASPFEPPLAWADVAVLLSLACIFALPATQDVVLRISLAALAATALGFAIAKMRTEHVAAPILERRVGPIGIDGRVEQAELRGKGVRVVLGELSMRRFAAENTPARVRISVRAGSTLPPPGSRVHVIAVLMPPPSPSSPGAYDFGRAAYFMRLGAVGYAYGHLTILGFPNVNSYGDALSLFVEGLRAKITARIHSVLPGSTGGIASALITGNRSAISDDDEKALRDAGLAHVLAIAGLHMALVGLGLFWVVRAVLAAVPKLALRFPIKKWAAAAALCSAAYYLMISGATSASTRAFVMLAMINLVRSASDLDAVASSCGNNYPGIGTRKPSRAGLPNVVRRSHELDCGRRVGGHAHDARNRARFGLFCGCPTLSARHHDDEPRRQRRHNSICDLSFRSSNPLRGARQSSRDADHGFCRHAGRRSVHVLDALWS